MIHHIINFASGGSLKQKSSAASWIHRNANSESTTWKQSLLHGMEKISQSKMVSNSSWLPFQLPLQLNQNTIKNLQTGKVNIIDVPGHKCADGGQYYFMVVPGKDATGKMEKKNIAIELKKNFLKKNFGYLARCGFESPIFEKKLLKPSKSHRFS